MELNLNKDTVLLIIGYQRFENILKIVQLAKSFNVRNILIFLDGPKVIGNQAHYDLKAFEHDLKQITSESNLEVKLHVNVRNLGCAVNVLTGIEYALEKFEYCIVLEDDCIPTLGFFEFVSVSKHLLDSEDSLWLICGSQFAPIEVTEGQSTISKYALTWGWCTSRSKWSLIKRKMFSPLPKLWPSIDFIERTYWLAGRRRALTGFTDVWDTVLVATMLANEGRALLPPYPLITNVGNDVHATHTKNDSRWLHMPTEEHLVKLEINYRANKVDKWIKANVFHISIKHIFTTRVTFLLDLVFRSRHKFTKSLIERLNKHLIKS